jgi:hypothetical protein
MQKPPLPSKQSKPNQALRRADHHEPRGATIDPHGSAWIRMEVRQ